MRTWAITPQKQWGSQDFLLSLKYPSLSTFCLSIPLGFLSNPFFAFQAMVMMKGLMGRCLNHETALERVWVKAKATEDKLSQLKN